MPVPSPEIDRLINDWSSTRDQFDRLMPGSDKKNVVLDQMRGLLQQCIQAGSKISQSEDRSVLQWIAREIGDCIYLLTDSRPDTRIRSVENQTNHHLPSATTSRAGIILPWIFTAACLLSVPLSVFVSRSYFLDRERTYEQRIAEMVTDNQRLAEEQRRKQNEQAEFDKKKLDLEKTIAETQRREDRLKSLERAIRIGDDLLDHVDEAKRSPLAIKRCLAFIRDSQLPDGAIRVRSDGTVWIQPSISAQAALALVTFHIQVADEEDHAKDLDRVLRWLKWYTKHQDAAGMIADQTGTVDKYTEHPTKSLFLKSVFNTFWEAVDIET